MNEQIFVIEGEPLSDGSSQVDRRYIKQLKEILPSAEDFFSGETESLIFVPVSMDTGALLYSVVRKSRRIGVEERVVSKVHLFKRETLDGFFLNPALYSFFCLSNGLFVSDSPVELPRSSFYDPRRWSAEFEKSQLLDIAQSIKIHDRSVVFHAGPKAKFLAAIAALVGENERWTMSFGCGLEVSNSCNLNLNLCCATDKMSKRFVIDQNIRYFETSNAEFSPSI